MLELRDIHKSYAAGSNTVEALRGLNLSFREHEFVSILGPSGCGKTTLLNIIGGLDQYSSGDLLINGRSTKDFKDGDWDAYRNHSIGFVFQSYNLIPHQTVLSNVELALTLSGVDKAERRERAKKVLEQVGLGDQLYKKPNQMSGGQMQRVAIARALINDPDILLADEPTGALDSETSVQIMDILKEISNDKLIIMVTHNPELAEHYSSRIVKLLDGRVIDDSSPYKAETVKQPEQGKKKKRPSMSFGTAMSLSLNNLMTKKARTFLTAFAGSIGIIGIALILSFSNGLQSYIDRMQEDTLSSYPISIEQNTIDMTSMMTSMMDMSGDRPEYNDDRIHAVSIMTTMIDTMLSEITTNNLTEFKAYLESEDTDIDGLVNDIQYGYSTPLNVYKSDSTDGISRVNPSAVFEAMGMTRMSSGMSSMTMIGGDVWTELVGGNELLNNQYEILAGHLPENFDEVVIMVTDDNEISDYSLYSLGLLDSSELGDTMKAIAAGEETELDTEDHSYSYDELLSLSFRLVPTPSFFEKDDKGLWVDRRDDEEYMSGVLENATEIKVVGILRPDEDAMISSSVDAIGYTGELMQRLIDEVESSEIVKQQRENPEIDVFTGVEFPEEGDDEGGEELTMEGLMAYISTLPEEDQMNASQTIAQMQQAGMGEDEILAAFGAQIGPTTTEATYEGNLALIGAVDPESPTSIRIYAKDFESKESVVSLISDYNKRMESEDREEDSIQYTDIVGLMMSSVSTIIDAISYVLIAFVSISLVVSSIMIGIITYISVLERTKEIGVLRAIGASKRDVSRVFNAETLIIGFASGALGIAVTLLLCIPANAIIKSLVDISNIARLPLAGAVILVLISMFLTFIAGLIPSRIAARKDPVDALRTE